MAKALREDYPEVESSFRFRNWGDLLVRTEEEATNTKEESIAFADPNFFSFFSVPVLSGDPETALQAPDAVAMSASMAEKYFDGVDPVGKVLIFEDEDRYRVTAVYEDIPHNAHFHFDFLLAMEGNEHSKGTSWLSNNYHTYFTLQEGADPEAFESKLPSLFKKYAGPQVQQILDKSIEEVEATGQGVWFELQPLRDIHLHSDRVAEIEANSDVKYVYIFSSIALFILLIACVNFMNLATARSANRAKEVGVRKTLGAQRLNLIRQFLTESVTMSVLAFVLVVILAQLVLPFFNQLVGRNLELPLSNPVFLGGVVFASVCIGLLAGSYPSFYLSSFLPLDTIQGQVRTSIKSGWFRNSSESVKSI